MALPDLLTTEFRARFSSAPLLVRAPGRINLIGEHTDYNQGLVLPAAIELAVYLAVGLNDSGTIHLVAHDLEQELSVPLDAVQPSPEMPWANYLLGVAAQLQAQGLPLPGFNCVFGGTIPQGAGLSSSAAVECGLAFALNHLLDLGLPKLALAQLAQQAEHTYAGVQCGLMDQFATLFGRPGQVVQLDCRSLEYAYFPFDTQACRIVLCDSGVKHSLASSEYNVRRQQCEQGVATLRQHYPDLTSLRDVTLQQLTAHRKDLDPVVWRRCAYVVAENERVERVCQLLRQGNLAACGQLLYASHAGLRDEYEVSCAELDLLVATAQTLPGVYGARMMGGGFGGCTLNLVAAGYEEEFVTEMATVYERQFEQALLTYRTAIAGGVSPLVPYLRSGLLPPRPVNQ